MNDEARLAEDQALLERARAGDEAAFDRLVQRHAGRVYALAQRMTGSAQDAEEIAQETFLSAYQGLDRFRGDANFGTWVHRIAANHALMRLRHRKVAGAAETQLQEEQALAGEGEALSYPISNFGKRADDEALDHELRRAIEQAVQELPELHRAVFLLKDVEGLSYEEIAEATGESVPAVKSRLHRARLALRHAIDAFYAERQP